MTVQELRNSIALRTAPRPVRVGAIGVATAAAAWLLLANASLTVNGLLIGSVYALGAIGLTLVYGNLHFPNIAHGDYMTLAAYLAFFMLTSVLPGENSDNAVGPFTFNYPLFLALPVAVVGVAAVAVAADRVVFRRLRRRGGSVAVMALASLGLAISVRGVIQMIWGTQPEQFPRVSKKFFQLPLDVRVPPDMLFVASAALVVAVGVYLLLTRTRLGKAMRATADNPDLAQVSGIDTERITMWTWVVSAGLAGVAGVLLALGQAQLLPVLGWKLLIPIFAATVVGGIGNPYGAFVAALLIGVVGEVSTEYITPSYKPAVYFAALLIVLLVRPRGLFSRGG